MLVLLIIFFMLCLKPDRIKISKGMCDLHKHFMFHIFLVAFDLICFITFCNENCVVNFNELFFQRFLFLNQTNSKLIFGMKWKFYIIKVLFLVLHNVILYRKILHLINLLMLRKTFLPVIKQLIQNSLICLREFL